MHFVMDRDAYDGATDLIASFGERAVAEAFARAERCRDQGNSIHYVYWCRIGRTILMLGESGPNGAVH